MTRTDELKSSPLKEALDIIAGMPSTKQITPDLSREQFIADVKLLRETVLKTKGCFDEANAGGLRVLLLKEDYADGNYRDLFERHLLPVYQLCEEALAATDRPEYKDAIHE